MMTRITTPQKVPTQQAKTTTIISIAGDIDRAGMQPRTENVNDTKYLKRNHVHVREVV